MQPKDALINQLKWPRQTYRGGSRPDPDWGLQLCPPQADCMICERTGEDKAKLRHLRDLFIQGVPGWLLCRAYNFPLRSGRKYHLLQHAWRHNWYDKKPSPSLVRGLPLKKIAELAILARLRDSWQLYSKDTPDKMIKLLVELEMAEQKEAAS